MQKCKDNFCIFASLNFCIFSKAKAFENYQAAQS